MKNSLALSYKVKHTFTTKPSDLAPRYLPRKMKSLYEDLYANIYGSFIHNHKILAAT